MNLFAISDLHLPGGDSKPMEVFGAHWVDHFSRIELDWRARVSPSDLVLIPGDISWAMYLPDALPDLFAIDQLPGQKVLLRGNHDYWWSAIGKLRSSLPPSMSAIQNDAIDFDGVIVCGSRGWLLPGTPGITQDDLRIYTREIGRLTLSLSHAAKIREQRLSQGLSARLIAMLHFPPFLDQSKPSEVHDLLAAHGVTDAVFGHLHGATITGGYQGVLDGVHYHLVSCDRLGFTLHELSST